MTRQIGDWVLKDIAKWLRECASGNPVSWVRTDLVEWADLLDPAPLSLRDKVARGIADALDGGPTDNPPTDGDRKAADAALAILRAELVAVLYTTYNGRTALPIVTSLIDGAA